jgi:UDP-3-O-[3-hydroxymyristoyl] N-acetylglucosamine deacetylase
VKSFGVISRQDIEVLFEENNGLGIRFILPSKNILPAHIDYLKSTQRNTVIGIGEEFLCLIEHFLGAAALLAVDNINLVLNDLELPFGDGSAAIWQEALWAYAKDINNLPRIDINEIIIVEDGDRFIELRPSDKFQISYKLSMPNTIVGEQVFHWELGDDISTLLKARTFASTEENKIMGLQEIVLGYDNNGYSQKLHFENEASAHKALDLIGDLMLAGINPIRLNAHIISYKGGHELNSKMTNKLNEFYKNNKVN